MILAVAPNPALDITYHLDQLRIGEVNRVASVSERAGGKGLNVARVLHAAGVPVRALAPVGGATGARIRSLLDAGGVPHTLVPVVAETRRTVVAAGTGLWEPGPELTSSEWSAFRAAFRAELPAAAVVTLSGSLPPGWPIDAYAQLIALCHAERRPVILDASGSALEAAIGSGPIVLKPNAAELADLIGRPVTSVSSAVAAARAAIDRGAREVIVSLGPLGLVACADGSDWHACPPEVVAPNPTGAGDALVAALAAGWLVGLDRTELLAQAVAWSAAAAAHPVAGEIDAAIADQVRPLVRVVSARPEPDLDRTGSR